MKDYDGKVRVVFKNLVVHPQVQRVHLAGCAAAKQGKFVEFKNAWWDKGYPGRDYSDTAIENIARDANLDVAKLKTDMDGDDCKKRVQQDQAEVSKFFYRGGGSTPAFFINGTHLGGALPIDDFKKVIDDKLRDVEHSGVAPADYYDKVIMATGEKKFRSAKDPKP